MACGGGGDSNANAVCPRVNPTELVQTAESVPTVSLAEAQNEVDFQIGIPARFPAGVSLKAITIEKGTPCAGSIQPRVELSFVGNAGFSLTESVGDEELADPTKTVRLNGVDALVANLRPNLGRAGILVLWKKSDVSFFATTLLSEDFTEQQFLDVLESIPD
jgi:hypothetical protein